jgi:hypothetical protein
MAKNGNADEDKEEPSPDIAFWILDEAGDPQKEKSQSSKLFEKFCYPNQMDDGDNGNGAGEQAFPDAFCD